MSGMRLAIFSAKYVSIFGAYNGGFDKYVEFNFLYIIILKEKIYVWRLENEIFCIFAFYFLDMSKFIFCHY